MAYLNGYCKTLSKRDKESGRNEEYFKMDFAKVNEIATSLRSSR